MAPMVDGFFQDSGFGAVLLGVREFVGRVRSVMGDVRVLLSFVRVGRGSEFCVASVVVLGLGSELLVSEVGVLGETVTFSVLVLVVDIVPSFLSVVGADAAVSLLVVLGGSLSKLSVAVGNTVSVTVLGGVVVGVGFGSDERINNVAVRVIVPSEK